MKTTTIAALTCAAFTAFAADFVPEEKSGAAIQKAIDAAFAAEGEFCGLYVLSGQGRVRCAAGSFEIGPGSQMFVPASSEPFLVEPDHALVVFRARSSGVASGPVSAIR